MDAPWSGSWPIPLPPAGPMDHYWQWEALIKELTAEIRALREALQERATEP